MSVDDVGADLEARLSERLVALALRVPVSDPPPPLPVSAVPPRRVRAPLRSAVLVAAMAAAAAAAIAVFAPDGGEVATFETLDPASPRPGEGSPDAAPVPPKPCSDTETDQVVAEGTDEIGAWEVLIDGEPPDVRVSVVHPGPEPGPHGASSWSWSSGAWARLLAGEVAVSWTERPGAPGRITVGVVTPEVVAVRVLFPDGDVAELCTTGRALGLGVVVFAVSDPSGSPVAMSLVDGDGLELARADGEIQYVGNGSVAHPEATLGPVERVEPRVPAPLTAPSP